MIRVCNMFLVVTEGNSVSYGLPDGDRWRELVRTNCTRAFHDRIGDLYLTCFELLFFYGPPDGDRWRELVRTN